MLNGRSRIFQTQKSAVSILAYMRYKTYATYDHPACVAFCLFLVACKSFNIFHERDQSLSPESGCMDRASTVPIKCSFWGAAIPTTTLTSKCQYRSKFHVLMAGCNGYSITNPTYNVDGLTGVSTGQATINSPNQCDSYITFKSHSGPYDPNICAPNCLA